jgi:hypothetical protein
MTTIYSTEGFVKLEGITFNGGEGAPGSTMSWSQFSPDPINLDGNWDVYDVDDDGKHDVLEDQFWPFAETPYWFTGYTITGTDGEDYPVFMSSPGAGFSFGFVPLPQDGSTQTLIPSTGTSNVYQSEAEGYPCFTQGSLIATQDGETPVEDLSIGDMVLNTDGNAVAVKWIGRQTVSTLFTPTERLMPVRFATGSLGDGLPHSDLTVTADHAMLIDGVLIHAGALANGTTITRVSLSEMGERFTVYHIETETHEIILANGAPAETFIDNVSRRVFDNYDEFEALYGEVPEMEELDYPRAMSARQVPPAIKAKLTGKKVA